MSKVAEICMAWNTQHPDERFDRITQLDSIEHNHQMSLRMENNLGMESASNPFVSRSGDRGIVQEGRSNRCAACCASGNADCNICDVKYAFPWL